MCRRSQVLCNHGQAYLAFDGKAGKLELHCIALSEDRLGGGPPFQVIHRTLNVTHVLLGLATARRLGSIASDDMEATSKWQLGWARNECESSSRPVPLLFKVEK